MSTRLGAFLVVAVVGAMLFCGCSGTAEKTVVLTYQAGSYKETLAMGWLEDGDQKARREVAEAEERVNIARRDYLDARASFDAEELPPGTVRPSAEEVKRLYDVAISEWIDYREAIAKGRDRFETFIRKFPHNWFARHRYAWFLTDNFMNYDAAAQWERVIQMEPRFPYAHNNLGSLYNHMGRDTEAMDLFRKAIELKNDDPTFYINLATNYSVHRKEAMERYGWDLPRTFRECVATFSKARELAPNDPDIAREVATQYVMAKYFNVENTADAALAAWTYYLSLNLTPSQRGFALRDMARIQLREKKDPGSAKTLLDQAKVLVPDDPTTDVLLKEVKSGPAPVTE